MRLNVARDPAILASKLRRDGLNNEEGAWLEDVASTWGRVGWKSTSAIEVDEPTVTFDELIARLRSADVGTAPLACSEMLETVRSVL
jgi:hypothetical protein